MKWMNAVRLLPLLLILTGCHNFANRFASVEKVCGVARASDTHYLELYTSQGKRLGQGEVIAAKADGTELPNRFTDKGCLVVSDRETAGTLILRHRLLSEGLALDTAALRDETTISQRSFSAYRYQPPALQCQGAVIVNGSTLPLFAAPAGVLPEAYKTLVNGKAAAASLDIKDWADGNYPIVGQVIELFSPEQRHYDFSCALMIDRTAPEFILPMAAAKISAERVVTPGEALTFPIDPNDKDVTLSVCIEKDDAPCVFQSLVDGKWIAPERGEFVLKVVAKDKAGNESVQLPVTLRIFDATKIAGIQSEIEVIRRLLAEQKGANARSRMIDLMATYKSLGTVQERDVVKKAIEETQFAVHASPDEIRFLKTVDAFVGWISGEKSNLLVFQKESSLIVRDEAGAEMKRWPLTGTIKVSVKPCVEGSYRELLVKNGTNVLRLTADALQNLGNLKWDNVQPVGSCQYRKYRATSTAPWTLMDLVDASRNQMLSVSDLWVLKPTQGDPLLLTRTAAGYATQNLGSTESTPQPMFDGLLVDKVLPDARLILVQKVTNAPSTKAQVVHWNGEAFVGELRGLEVNTLDAAGNRVGGNKTLYRGVVASRLEWFLHDAALPELALSINLPTAADPEKVQIGDDILVTSNSSIAGLLDLNVYNGKGTLLSLLRLDDLGPVLLFKGVIGNKLILETADTLIVMNPFPHTQLSGTRTTIDQGSQWADSKGRMSRSIISAHQNTWIQEALTVFGQTWSFLQKAMELADPIRFVDKPYAAASDQAAFVTLPATVILVHKNGSSQTLPMPEIGEIQRLDFSNDGESLILVTRSGHVYKKSITDMAAPASEILPSVWSGCDDSMSQLSLDFIRKTETYLRVACGQVSSINLQGTTEVLEPKSEKTWITAQGNGLIVSTQAAYVDGLVIEPGLVNDPLNLARMNDNRSHVVLGSRSGRIFLVRLQDQTIWEMRRSKSRTMTLDDVSFNDGKHTFSLISPEGILEFPVDPETFTKE